MFNSKSDFGASIKQKYPQYANLDNTEVANKVLALYPQYNDMIQAPGMFGQAKEIASQAWTGLKKAGSDIMDITDLQIDKPREQQGVIGKSISDIQKRASNLEKISSDMGLKNPGYFEQKRMQLRGAGQLAGAASDVFGNVFSGAIETVVPKSLREQGKEVLGVAGQTGLGQDVKGVAQTAFQKYQQFKQNNPELAADVEAGGNIANFALNFVGVGGTGAIASKGDDFVRGVKSELETMVRQSAPKVGEVAGKTAGFAGKAGTGATEAGLSFTTGISREAQQAIKQSPELYQAARKGAITREGVTEDVVGALKTRMSELSDLGKGYESVRKSPVTIKKNEIGKVVSDFMKKKEISYIDLPVKDRKTIQQALDYVKEYGDTLSAKNALSLRSKLDDLASWGTEATDEGKRFIRGLRSEIDSVLGQKIPGLKALDAKYGPERQFINKIKGLVLNADGTIKDNAISTIANLVGKNKEMKLARIEKLIPGFGDKVRALKAFEEIQNLSSIKTGAVTRQLASFAIGGVPGFIATHPYVVGYALERYGFAKQYIKKLLAKGKNVSPEEIANVKKAIAKTPKKEAEKVISQGGKNLLKEAPTPVKKATGTEPTPTLPILETSEVGPFVSVDKSSSKQVLNTQTDTSVPSLPAPKISTAVTPTSKKVVSPSKKLKTNKDIIQKISKKQETPKIPTKNIGNDISETINGMKEGQIMYGVSKRDMQMMLKDPKSFLEKFGDEYFDKVDNAITKLETRMTPKPNTKRALPMSQKSDVVYSKPVEPVTKWTDNKSIQKALSGLPKKESVGGRVKGYRSTTKEGYEVEKVYSWNDSGKKYDTGRYQVYDSNPERINKIFQTLKDKGFDVSREEGSSYITIGRTYTPQSKSALPMSSRTPVKYGKVEEITPRALVRKAKDVVGPYRSSSVDSLKKDISDMKNISSGEKKELLALVDKTPKYKDSYNGVEKDYIRMNDFVKTVKDKSGYDSYKSPSILDSNKKDIVLHRSGDVDRTGHGGVFFTDSKDVATKIYGGDRPTKTYTVTIPDKKYIKSYRSVQDAYLDVGPKDNRYLIIKDIKDGVFKDKTRSWERKAPSIMKDYGTTDWDYDFNRKLDKVVGAEMKKRGIKIVEYTNVEDLPFPQYGLDSGEYVVYDKSLIKPNK